MTNLEIVLLASYVVTFLLLLIQSRELDALRSVLIDVLRVLKEAEDEIKRLKNILSSRQG